jgi:hypothetical protein
VNTRDDQKTVQFVGDSSVLRALGGFTQIPNTVLRHPELSTAAKVLYGLLLSYAWQEDFCYPPQKRLMADAALSDRSIHKALQELKRHKLIDWKRRGLGKPNIYFILEDFYVGQDPGGNQNRKTYDSRSEHSSNQESENLRNSSLDTKTQCTNTHMGLVCDGLFKEVTPKTLLDALPKHSPTELQDRIDQINLLARQGGGIQNPMGFLVSSFSRLWIPVPGHIPRAELEQRRQAEASKKIREQARRDEERRQLEEKTRLARERLEALAPREREEIEKTVIAGEPGLAFLEPGSGVWRTVFDAALVEVIDVR